MSRAEIAMDWFGNNVIRAFRFYVESGFDLLEGWVLGIAAVVTVCVWFTIYEAATYAGIARSEAAGQALFQGFGWAAGVIAAVTFVAGFFFGPIR